jgi:hypothetical protein
VFPHGVQPHPRPSLPAINIPRDGDALSTGEEIEYLDAGTSFRNNEK